MLQHAPLKAPTQGLGVCVIHHRRRKIRVVFHHIVRVAKCEEKNASGARVRPSQFTDVYFFSRPLVLVGKEQAPGGQTVLLRWVGED